jgi:hypothetical protein
MSDEAQENLERRARALLHESAEQLDGRTRSRLTQARHAAVAALRQPQVRVWRWLAPLSGATATAVLAAILLFNPARHSVDQSEVVVADELEMMTSEDSLDFYRDVEFYAWLDSVLPDPSDDNGV